MPTDISTANPETEPAPSPTHNLKYPWPRVRRPMVAKILVVSQFRPVRHPAHKN